MSPTSFIIGHCTLRMEGIIVAETFYSMVILAYSWPTEGNLITVPSY